MRQHEEWKYIWLEVDGYNVAIHCIWTSNFQGSLRAKFQGSSWSRQSSCMLSTKKCPFMALQWLILFVVITGQDSVVKGEVCDNCSIDCSMCTCAPGTYGVAGGADGRGDWHKSDLCAIKRFMMSCLYRRQFIISWMTYHMLWWLSNLSSHACQIQSAKRLFDQIWVYFFGAGVTPCDPCEAGKFANQFTWEQRFVGQCDGEAGSQVQVYEGQNTGDNPGMVWKDRVHACARACLAKIAPLNSMAWV